MTPSEIEKRAEEIAYQSVPDVCSPASILAWNTAKRAARLALESREREVQAARNEALEEAAKRCETTAKSFRSRKDGMGLDSLLEWEAIACEHAANDIRSLKSKEAT